MTTPPPRFPQITCHSTLTPGPHGASAAAGIATDMTVWEGIVVSPLEKAYEKPPERKEGDPGDDLGEDDDMDMGEN